MIVQIVTIVLLASVALGAFLIYNRMNRTHYIEYTESGVIDYKVQYKDNEFFDDDLIGSNQTYISALVDGITADFIYKLRTGASELSFNYNYKIDAELIVANKNTGTPYYTYEENIYPPKGTPAETASNVDISETVSIDYERYNDIATSFIETYGLSNVASAKLVITLDVELLSSNKQFAAENRNEYTSSLNIPLAEDSFAIYTTASSPDNEVKVLEYQSIANREVFSVTAVVSLVLAALLALVLFIFMNLTRNEDITYAVKIRRILRAYGSYIQRIEGEFDREGYQVVIIKTIVELLGIRDTIQSPILVSENHDETMTQFLIPTNTKLLYVFEIKVDNYDEIYAKVEIGEEPELEIELELESSADADESEGEATTEPSTEE